MQQVCGLRFSYFCAPLVLDVSSRGNPAPTGVNIVLLQNCCNTRTQILQEGRVLRQQMQGGAWGRREQRGGPQVRGTHICSRRNNTIF